MSRAAWVSRASVGSSRRNSPIPSAGNRNSVSADSGQPPLGNAASSAACPVGCVLGGSVAGRPRQTRRPASSASSATTCPGSAVPISRLADQAAVHAFDGELLTWLECNRRMRGIARQQAQAAIAMLQALDGEFTVDAGDHDLSVACLVRSVHGDEIAVEDAVVA